MNIARINAALGGDVAALIARANQAGSNHREVKACINELGEVIDALVDIINPEMPEVPDKPTEPEKPTEPPVATQPIVEPEKPVTEPKPDPLDPVSGEPVGDGNATTEDP